MRVRDVVVQLFYKVGLFWDSTNLDVVKNDDNDDDEDDDVDDEDEIALFQKSIIKKSL